MAKRRSRVAASASPRTAARPRGRSHAPRRALIAEDLLCVVGVGDAQIAPDGSLVAFVRKVVGERQRGESAIWAAATDGGSPPRPLTAGTKDSMPRFSPDGGRLAFVRVVEGKGPQVAVLPLAGGEARVLTRFPEGSIAAIRWFPDGSKLAVTFRATEAAWTEAGRRERERTGGSEPPRVLETRWYRLDGDGWFGAARHALYQVDARTGRNELLYDQDALGDFDFDIAPDGKRIALATNRQPDGLLKPWRDEIVILDVSKRSLIALDDLPVGPKSSIAWSPDGKRLAWAGRKGRDGVYSTENLELWTCAAPGAGKVPYGAPRSLTSRDDLCLAAATLSDGGEAAFDAVVRWMPDSVTILTRIGWHGEGQLVAIGLDGERPRFLTKGQAELSIGTISADGRLVAAIRTDAVTPAEAGVIALPKPPAAPGSGTWRPLTAFNQALLEEVEIVAPEEHWIEADDGHRTQFWLLRPPSCAPKDVVKRGRRPAILEIHGGPHTQYGHAFFHEFQLLAAQGYLVAYPNPRGSKGYGRDHCAAIRGSWGQKDWVDVQAVTRFLEHHAEIDPKRIGIMGGSYGGYMTNWAIAHSKGKEARYRAAITDRCVANMLSFCGNSDYPLLPGEYWPGTNFENPERMWASSPIAHFKGVSTPTLIIHSEGDFRCNIEQAEQVHTALVLQGVPTRFVRYPMSTSHGMSRAGPPDLRIHRLNEIVAWWRRWL
jgi:dipeptidyl aminopeptidase/acylaminoacyl peptidase